MRLLGTPLAAVVLLATAVGCGGHGSDASGRDPASPSTGSSRNASADDEAQIKSIAQLFVNDVFTGQSSDAFVLMSKRCQARLSAVSFGAIVENLSARTGSPHTFKTFAATVTGDHAVASYTFSDHRFNTKKDRWARDPDGWRWDSCNGLAPRP